MNSEQHHQRREPHHPADERLTRGEHAAETVARGVGSWRFIIWQNVIVLLWMAFNVIAIFGLHWDPYPFILLNLVFSWQASNTGPILQMTGNAAAKRDRALWEMMARVLRHVEKVAEADHAEHGRLLREIHSHTRCAGHTVIETTTETATSPTAATERRPERDPQTGRFVSARR